MIKFILLYFCIGIGIFLAICNLYDMWGKERGPHILVAVFWPIIFILGLIDLVDWFIKEMRRNE